MKSSLLVSLCWMLATTGTALECQTCTDSQCSSTILRNCSTESWCMTASIKSNVSGTVEEREIKGCAPDSICTANGFDTFTANFTSSSTLTSVYCCNGNNCNNANIVFLTAIETDNSLECISCEDSECNSVVQCRGSQDRCFQSNVTDGSQDKPLFGCVSQNVCEAALALKYLPFLKSLGNITSGPSCCLQSNCNILPTAAAAAAAAAAVTLPNQQNCMMVIVLNGAPKLSLGLLHLLLGLLVSVLYLE